MTGMIRPGVVAACAQTAPLAERAAGKRSRDPDSGGAAMPGEIVAVVGMLLIDRNRRGAALGSGPSQHKSATLPRTECLG